MNINIIYDITREMPFGLSIIIYFFLAGISAGSFVLSTLNPVFGLDRFKPLEKRGLLLALIFGLISPLCIFHLPKSSRCVPPDAVVSPVLQSPH